MPPTLAELEQQWAASFAAVTLAQDHLNLLIRQHASLGEKIARAKGPWQPVSHGSLRHGKARTANCLCSNGTT